MPNNPRKNKKKYHPSELLTEAKKLAEVKSNRAFAEVVGLPYSTVQNWSEGKGSAIAVRFLEMYIENKALEAKNDALLLLATDIGKTNIKKDIQGEE